jgi:hypothetical protein
VLTGWEQLYRRMRNVAAGYSNHCEESGSTRKLDREFRQIEADAREREAQPVRYWSIADDANKCIHKAHCLATSKEMQALRLKALEEAQPAAQEPGDAKDAARWRMLPAFFEEYQINAMKLYRDIDEALAAQPAAQEPKP